MLRKKPLRFRHQDYRTGPWGYSRHDFTIQRRSGLTNGNADALPRRPYESVVASLDQPGVQIDRVRDVQRRDHTLADIIRYLEKESLPTNSAAAKAVLHSIENYYLDRDGLSHLGTGRSTCPRDSLSAGHTYFAEAGNFDWR